MVPSEIPRVPLEALQNISWGASFDDTAGIIDHEGSIVIPSEGNDTSVTYITLTISTVGITLSTIALILLLLTAFLFAEWRQNYKNQLLIQFMFARIIFTHIIYFHDITVAFELYDRKEVGVPVDVLLSFYFDLTLVAWMFVFSRQMYIALVKVFNNENPPLWKVSLLTWTVPGVITITSLSIKICLKITNELRFYSFYIALVKWPILIANGVYLILATKSILRNNQSRAGSNRRIVVVMLVLIFMFSFQNLFSDIYGIIFLVVYLNYGEVPRFLGAGKVALDMYALYHCAFSIMFWVFGNTKTRNLWKLRVNWDKKLNRSDSNIEHCIK